MKQRLNIKQILNYHAWDVQVKYDVFMLGVSIFMALVLFTVLW